MRIVIILLFLSLIFITVLTQRATLKISNEDKLNIRLDLMIMALELSGSKSKKPKKSPKRNSILSQFKKTPDLIKCARYLTSKSAVTVKSFVIYAKPKNPLDYLKISLGLAGFASLLSFIRANAEEFEVATKKLNLISESWDSPAPKIDIEFSFILVYLFISLFVFTYYRAKALVRKRRRNVG